MVVQRPRQERKTSELVKRNAISKREGVMTDRERIEVMLQRKKPDRVPIWPFAYGGFCSLNAGYSIAEAYNNPQKALEAQRWCCEQYGWVFAPGFNYAAYGGWEFGGDIKWPTSKFDQAPTITRYPVQTEEDAWNLQLPDITRAGFLPLLFAFNRLSSQERLDNEPFNISVRGGGAFGRACNICGLENLLRWTIKRPEIVHHLLRLATDHSIQVCEYMKDNFGLEGALVRCGEATTSNQLISTNTFKEFALPYLKESHNKILSLGYRNIYLHICGEQNANLTYWAQVPMGDPGIVSIGHEIDVQKAAEYFPNDIIVGNLNPSIIQTGTPHEVYEASRIVIEKGRKCSGGFIFSPGCELPPMAPSINVWMLTKAANDFGWYD